MQSEVWLTPSSSRCRRDVSRVFRIRSALWKCAVVAEKAPTAKQTLSAVCCCPATRYRFVPPGAERGTGSVARSVGMPLSKIRVASRPKATPDEGPARGLAKFGRGGWRQQAEGLAGRVHG